jgi:HSP20 family molecular chaperone IbpA
MTTAITEKGTETPELVQQRQWRAPYVDIYENKDELLLIADIPGVETDKLKIQLDKNELTIEALRLPSQHKNVLVSEFIGHDYRRTFVVPPGIDGQKIKAETKHGVLQLHLPKSETAKPKTIPVKAG